MVRGAEKMRTVDADTEVEDAFADETHVSGISFDASGRPIAEFGNERIMKIPRNIINILPQIRKDFDPVKLQELADSMPLENKVDKLEHELMEPIIEGLHTEESARCYLEQYNRANDTHFTVEELIPYELPQGTRYVIHIAGERRIRAADLLIEQHGYSPESTLMSSVYENISYVDALPKQFIENNARVNPSRPDEARAMRGYIDMMREIEPRYTQKECADKFAVNPQRVHDALVFTDYPASMQNLEKYYPYAWVVGAYEIYQTWLAYYREHSNSLTAAHLREKGGLLAEEMGYEEASENGSPTWFASDGSAYFTTPEDVATHEVETCFEIMKAEALARKSGNANGMRRNRDVSLGKQLEEAKALIVRESAGIAQDELDDVESLDDQERYRQELMATFESGGDNDGERQSLVIFSYNKRRKIASANLFEAVINALWILDARNELPDSARARVVKYALQITVPESLDSATEALAFEEESV